MIKLYIETSAVNYFLDVLTGVDAQATREYQLSKGREWFISTSVLWEIMQIRDFKDYDAVLFLATFLFHPHLLKSAPEIVLEYFDQGCPSYHVMETPYTASTIGKAWERACGDRSYSFNIIGTPFLNLTLKYKEISRHLPFIYSPQAPVDASVPEYVQSVRDVVDHFYREFTSDTVSKQIASLRRIAILMLFVQVCSCVDLSQDVLIDYWKNRGIESPLDRFRFIVEKQPNILHQGPLWNMANGVLLQTVNKRSASRGALHDGLHAVYLPFVDVFLTNDEHFRQLREKANKFHYETLYRKVYHLNEMKLTYTDWDVTTPQFK
jgi:hypothetical protein